MKMRPFRPRWPDFIYYTRSPVKRCELCNHAPEIREHVERHYFMSFCDVDLVIKYVFEDFQINLNRDCVRTHCKQHVNLYHLLKRDDDFDSETPPHFRWALNKFHAAHKPCKPCKPSIKRR